MPPESTKLSAVIKPKDDAELLCKWKLFVKIDEEGSNTDTSNYEGVSEVSNGTEVEYEPLDLNRTYRLNVVVSGKGGLKYTREATSELHEIVPNGEKEHKIQGSTSVVNTSSPIWRIKPKP